MSLDLPQIDAMIAETERRIKAQSLLLESPDLDPLAKGDVRLRLGHLRRDLATFRSSRAVIAEGAG